MQKKVYRPYIVEESEDMLFIYRDTEYQFVILVASVILAIFIILNTERKVGTLLLSIVIVIAFLIRYIILQKMGIKFDNRNKMISIFRGTSLKESFSYNELYQISSKIIRKKIWIGVPIYENGEVPRITYEVILKLKSGNEVKILQTGREYTAEIIKEEITNFIVRL